MFDANTFETLDPVERAYALKEAYANVGMGAITVDLVRFVEEIPQNERTRVAGILLANQELLSRNARAFLLKTTGQWVSKPKGPLPRPYNWENES